MSWQKGNECEGKSWTLASDLQGTHSQRKERPSFLLPERKFISMNKSLKVCAVSLGGFAPSRPRLSIWCLTVRQMK